MFTVNVVSKEGLDFGRYLYSMNISDPVKKRQFSEEEIDKQELQILCLPDVYRHDIVYGHEQECQIYFTSLCRVKN